MTNLKTQNSIQRDRRESRIIDQIYQPISEDLDQVTKNLITLLNSLGESGIAALIIVFAVIFTYRKFLK